MIKTKTTPTKGIQCEARVMDILTRDVWIERKIYYSTPKNVCERNFRMHLIESHLVEVLD